MQKPAPQGTLNLRQLPHPTIMHPHAGTAQDDPLHGRAVSQAIASRNRSLPILSMMPPHAHRPRETQSDC